MFTPRLRLLLIGICLILGLRSLMANAASPSGWALVVAAMLFGYGYIRYGTVWLAWQAWLRDDAERLVTLLSTITVPEALGPGQRAYYDFLSGIVSRRRNEVALARTHFERAVSGRARTPRAHAMFYVHLAEAATVGNDPAGADAALARARELDPLLDLDAAMREAVTKASAA